MLDKSAIYERDSGASLGEIGLERFPPYLVYRLMSAWEDFLRGMLKPLGMTPLQMRVLGALSVRTNPSIQELSSFTLTEPSTMSRTLDSMENKGFITRANRSEDGRLRVIAITEEGKAAFAAVWPKMRKKADEMMDGIEAREQDAIMSGLRQMISNLER